MIDLNAGRKIKIVVEADDGDGFEIDVPSGTFVLESECVDDGVPYLSRDLLVNSAFVPRYETKAIVHIPDHPVGGSEYTYTVRVIPGRKARIREELASFGVADEWDEETLDNMVAGVLGAL